MSLFGKTEITGSNLTYLSDESDQSRKKVRVDHRGIKRLEDKIRYKDEQIVAEVTGDNKIFMKIYTDLFNETIDIRLTKKEEQNILDYVKNYR